MSYRRLASMGALAMIVAVVSVSVAGQEGPPKPSKMPAAVAIDKAKVIPKNYTGPKTAWGEPDLQGVWSYATTTPLQRPDALAGKETLTETEIEALDEQQDARADALPRAGDPGTYNTFWFDQGKSNGRTSLIIDPPNGKLPWKPEALKANAERVAYQRAHPADSYLDLSPTDRCIMYHGVPPLPSGYNNTYQILQTPGLVAILDENIHHVRLIPLDGRAHLADSVRHWNGDSRGHWEGKTLVVDTTNFNHKTALRYNGSENTHAVERFTRVSDRLIDYQYTITDPTKFTSSFTVAIPMPKRDDKLFEYACHEGNHSMVGMLGGARAEEKAAAASAKR
jgi:hypothetical protein